VDESTLVNNEKSAGSAARSVSDTEIAALAYTLWQGRGCPIGSPDEDWFRAEAELNNGKLPPLLDTVASPTEATTYGQARHG
jgi:hypothetical protein